MPTLAVCDSRSDVVVGGHRVDDVAVSSDMVVASHGVRPIAARSFGPASDSGGDFAERWRTDGVWQFLSERVGVFEEMSFRGFRG